ncbi:MAG: maleylpyruvate isomerase family mycothiol-dependent enzyme [Actinobacteria bacterium]|nr:maleylpyruvate isomerase family mycothiol-dependent enzyme [Actinomycetota bacterium]MBV9935948.1 maleylpyruvate isomerase family mycothiol-dependent enzyme [Actinomycetota bacterium]
MSAFTDLVDDFAAEQAVLDALVDGRPESDWRTPSAAAGWSIADSIAHLAMSDEVALRSLEGTAEAYFQEAMADPSDALAHQNEAASSRTGPEVLAWWRDVRTQLVDGLRALPDGARLFWGIGEMSAASFTTARLMECWAHGLDCFAGLGVAPVDTDRIRHVCFLGYRTLAYAFNFSGRTPSAPLRELRLSLTAPDGVTVWAFGDDAAPQLIEGAAGEWARVAVHRMPLADAHTLVAKGQLAEEALAVAKAYLA